MSARTNAHRALDALLDVVGDDKSTFVAAKLCTIASQIDQERRDREALAALEEKLERDVAAMTDEWSALRRALEADVQFEDGAL